MRKISATGLQKRIIYKKKQKDYNVYLHKLSTIKEGTTLVIRMPPVDGYGISIGAELVLQDKMGRGITSLKAMADKVIEQIMKQSGVQSAYTVFRVDYPQFELEVDEDKAMQLGVDVSAMLGTVQNYFAGDQSLNFTRFGKFYRVNIKADGIFRTDESAFNEIFVRNNQGEMIPVMTLL
ncbi:efflux RND transporter permease subunit [Emticicia fontis]